MVIRKNNTNSFFRKLFAGQVETVCLLKRENDQRAGTVRTVHLWPVRWKPILQTGEPYQGSMTSVNRRTVCIPRFALDEAGVAYISALDRFKDEQGRHWQPESTTVIDIKLFENIVNVDCLRCDVPSPPGALL